MTKARPIVAVALLATIAIAPLLIAPVGAQQLTDRAKQIGGKFMCMCSCSQVLTECNHVGCSTSASMLKELNVALARGKYAEPPKSGFSLVAWALPSIYLFVGTAVVIFVISRWRKRPVQPTGPASGAPGISAELLERARAQASRETQD